MSRGRVLITGAAGLVGSRLVSRCLREGFAVRALDLQPVHVAGVEGIVGDVTDVDTVRRAAAGAELIAHCAAVIAGAPEVEMTRVNVEGTRVLLDAAAHAGSHRVLYVSSAVVYAFADRDIVDESTPFRKDGPAFHMGRVRAEGLVWAASARGLPITVFRPYSTWARTGRRRGRHYLRNGSRGASSSCVVMARRPSRTRTSIASPKRS